MRCCLTRGLKEDSQWAGGAEPPHTAVSRHRGPRREDSTEAGVARAEPARGRGGGG